MNTSKCITLSNFPSTINCIFCKTNYSNNLDYGEIYQCGSIYTHYFCLLFSHRLRQVGKDNEGILGFLYQHVLDYVNRQNNTCYYCKKKTANIKCKIRECKKQYHFPCGLKNGSIFTFGPQFVSYCAEHNNLPSPPPEAYKDKNVRCLICLENMELRQKKGSIIRNVFVPCCKRIWLHRKCIQNMAINAGYFFKCPNCNNEDDFRRMMKKHGIFIPDKDASWEADPNAYHELLERPKHCSIENCKCPRGRTYSPYKGFFKLLICQNCGATGAHKACVTIKNRTWICSTCYDIDKKIHESKHNQSNEIPIQPTVLLPKINLDKFDGTISSVKLTVGSDNIDNSNSRKRRHCSERKHRNQDMGNNPSVNTLRANGGEIIKVFRLDHLPGVDSIEEVGGINCTKTIELLGSDGEEENNSEQESLVTSALNYRDLFRLTSLQPNQHINKISNVSPSPSALLVDLTDSGDESDRKREKSSHVDYGKIIYGTRSMRNSQPATDKYNVDLR